MSLPDRTELRVKIGWLAFRAQRWLMQSLRRAGTLRDVFTNGVKLTAVITTVCFVLTSVCGQVIAATTQEEARSAAWDGVLNEFILPYSVGRITDGRSFDGSDTVVVNIQDLHCHAEVQRNISKVLKMLDERYSLSKVYIEGGVGSISTAWSGQIANPFERKSMVESLVDSGRLNGAEYYAISANKPDLLSGIEDERVYNDNLSRLGKLISMNAEVAAAMPVFKESAGHLKERYFSDANRRLERILAKYAAHEINADKFYELLFKCGERREISRDAYPAINEFLSLNRLQQNIDFRKAGAQLRDLLATLRQELPYNTYMMLIDKAGDLSRVDELYVVLSRLNARNSRAFVSAGRELKEFLAFVDANQRLNPMSLVRDERRLVRDLHEELSITDTERDIAFVADFVAYIDEYFNNKISAEDYVYYRDNAIRFDRLWAKYSGNGAVEHLAPCARLLETYYTINVERNAIFARNVIGAAVQPKREPVRVFEKQDQVAKALSGLEKEKKIIVMVTGGFHTAGFTEILKANRISYLVITPNVSQETAFAETVYNELAREQSAVLTQTMAVKALSEMIAKQDAGRVQFFLRRQWAEALLNIRYRQMNRSPETLADELNEEYVKLGVACTVVAEDNDVVFQFRETEPLRFSLIDGKIRFIAASDTIHHIPASRGWMQKLSSFFRHAHLSVLSRVIDKLSRLSTKGSVSQKTSDTDAVTGIPDTTRTSRDLGRFGRWGSKQQSSQQKNEVTPTAQSATPSASKEFVIGKTNNIEAIENLRKTGLNGVPISMIEKNARPGVDSTDGFLAKDDDFVNILKDDTLVVTANGFTHQQLAEPLFAAMKAAGSGMTAQFTFKGKKFDVFVDMWRKPTRRPLFAGFRGYQESVIGEDGVRANKDYTVTDVKTGEGVKFSGMLPEYITRYGFYEGNTPYRLSPEMIMKTFFGVDKPKNDMRKYIRGVYMVAGQAIKKTGYRSNPDDETVTGMPDTTKTSRDMGISGRWDSKQQHGSGPVKTGLSGLLSRFLHFLGIRATRESDNYANISERLAQVQATHVPSLPVVPQGMRVAMQNAFIRAFDVIAHDGADSAFNTETWQNYRNVWKTVPAEVTVSYHTYNDSRNPALDDLNAIIEVSKDDPQYRPAIHVSEKFYNRYISGDIGQEYLDAYAEFVMRCHINQDFRKNDLNVFIQTRIPASTDLLASSLQKREYRLMHNAIFLTIMKRRTVQSQIDKDMSVIRNFLMTKDEDQELGKILNALDRLSHEQIISQADQLLSDIGPGLGNVTGPVRELLKRPTTGINDFHQVMLTGSMFAFADAGSFAKLKQFALSNENRVNQIRLVYLLLRCCEIYSLREPDLLGPVAAEEKLGNNAGSWFPWKWYQKGVAWWFEMPASVFFGLGVDYVLTLLGVPSGISVAVAVPLSGLFFWLGHVLFRGGAYARQTSIIELAGETAIAAFSALSLGFLHPVTIGILIAFSIPHLLLDVRNDYKNASIKMPLFATLFMAVVITLNLTACSLFSSQTDKVTVSPSSTGQSAQTPTKKTTLDLTGVNKYVPDAVRWLLNHVNERTGLPYSFYVPTRDEEQIYGQIDASTQAGQIERVLIAYGSNTYDIAVHQLALISTGDKSKIELTLVPTKLFWKGSYGDFATIRGGYNGTKEQPFIYDPSNPGLVSADVNAFGQRGYVFRMVSTNGQWGNLKVPLTNDMITWPDWQLVSGENAWLGGIASCQQAYALYFDPSTNKYTVNLKQLDSIKFAQELARCGMILQAENGGIRAGPIGTWHEKGDHFYYNSIFTENNVSAFAEYRMLYAMLGDDSYLKAMNGIWNYMGLVWDPVNKCFAQGMRFEKGQWQPVTEYFATDCQTWAIGTFGPKSIDERFGEGSAYQMWKTTKRLAGFDFMRHLMLSYTTSTRDEECGSPEWTEGGILACKELADYYAQSHPDWAKECLADREDMIAAVDQCKVISSDGTVGYLYATKRVHIVFGWWANKIQSTASTGWRVMNAYNFNPLWLGGKQTVSSTVEPSQNWAKSITISPEATTKKTDAPAKSTPATEAPRGNLFAQGTYGEDVQSQWGAHPIWWDFNTPIHLEAGDVLRLSGTLVDSKAMGVQLKATDEADSDRGDMIDENNVGGTKTIDIVVPSTRDMRRFVLQLGNAWDKKYGDYKKAKFIPESLELIKGGGSWFASIFYKTKIAWWLETLAASGMAAVVMAAFAPLTNSTPLGSALLISASAAAMALTFWLPHAFRGKEVLMSEDVLELTGYHAALGALAGLTVLAVAVAPIWIIAFLGTSLLVCLTIVMRAHYQINTGVKRIVSLRQIITQAISSILIVVMLSGCQLAPHEGTVVPFATAGISVSPTAESTHPQSTHEQLATSIVEDTQASVAQEEPVITCMPSAPQVDPVITPKVVASLIGADNIWSYTGTEDQQEIGVVGSVNDKNKKSIRWHWHKVTKNWFGWGIKNWANGSATVNVARAGVENCIFRCVINGTRNAQFELTFEDGKTVTKNADGNVIGHEVTMFSKDFVYVQDAQQYLLIRLDDVDLKAKEQGVDFDWSTFKQVKFRPLSDNENTVTLSEPQILNVKLIRARGMGIGIFRAGGNNDKNEDDGNQFPVFNRWDRRLDEGKKPVSVLSFTGIKEDLVSSGRIAQWTALIANGQIPHDTLEIDYPAEPDILSRIIRGEIDDLLIKRAKDIAAFGKPLLQRPLHEANGGWYRWSVRDRKDADLYVAAWKHIYSIYMSNGATNVRFVFAPHNYEPDTLEQKQHYELMEYIIEGIRDQVDFIGIDAYSYPDSGGFVNELITGMIERFKKFGKPMILAEMSSAMPDDHPIWPKDKFWEYFDKDLHNGMYPELVGTFIFDTAKEENGLKDFRIPLKWAKKMQNDPFYFTDPISPWWNNPKRVSGKGGSWLHEDMFRSALMKQIARVYRLQVSWWMESIAAIMASGAVIYALMPLFAHSTWLGAGFLISAASVAAALTFCLPHAFRGKEVLLSEDVLKLTGYHAALGALAGITVIAAVAAPAWVTVLLGIGLIGATYGVLRAHYAANTVTGKTGGFAKQTIRDIDVAGKRVVVRVDYNVVKGGKIKSEKRITATLDTITYLLSRGASVVLMSHNERPNGKVDPLLSLEPVAAKLNELLAADADVQAGRIPFQGVQFVKDCVGSEAQAAAQSLKPGQVLLLENLRFHKEEELYEKYAAGTLDAVEASDVESFTQQLADLGDVLVQEAFGTVHRAHASTAGMFSVAKDEGKTVACGLLVEKELKYLGDVIAEPERDFVAILGGSKVSDKIKVIESLLEKVDVLVIGGAMAYTFLAAQGIATGDSRIEKDQIEFAKAMIAKAKERGVTLILPQDHVVVKKGSIDFEKMMLLEGNERQVTVGATIADGYMGVDIGPKTIEAIKVSMKKAKTVMWNGPAGVFEIDALAEGTIAEAELMAAATENGAVTVVGGGDSVTAAEKAQKKAEKQGRELRFSHLSTGGGASLEFLEGKKLPGIEALPERIDETDGPMETSELHAQRLKYKPILPAILKKGPASVTPQFGAATQSIADQDALRQIFPNTYGMPVVTFAKGNQAKKMSRPINVGVILSGGQAPGGHNVIAGMFDALKKTNSQNRLIGFIGGPGGIIKNKHTEITAQLVNEFRNTGGFDIIGSGRDKIEKPEEFELAKKHVLENKINVLVVIGGDDSNTNAALLAEYFRKEGLDVSVIGVPKTIDGDLKNEEIETSFGFDTATKIYSSAVGDICRDARSAGKYWHFVRLMGRSASHITLEVGLKTQPNVVLIGEEVLAKNMTLAQVVDSIAMVVAKRARANKNYGVVLVPEGLIEFIPEIKELISALNDLLAKHEHELAGMQSIDSKKEFIYARLPSHLFVLMRSLPSDIASQLMLDRDPHGNVQVSQIDTEKLLMAMVKARLSELKQEGRYTGKFSSIAHFFGYEGRSSAPSNFDANYTYALGYNAVALALNGLSGYLSSVRRLTDKAENWECGGVPLTKMMNIEMRKGKGKPVIQKALVDLNGAPFRELAKNRDAWAVGDRYLFPGSIQYFGKRSVTDTTTKTLIYEQAAVAEKTSGALSERHHGGGSWFSNSYYKTKIAWLLETSVAGGAAAIVMSALVSLTNNTPLGSALLISSAAAAAALTFFLPHAFRGKEVLLSEDVLKLTGYHAAVGALAGLTVVTVAAAAPVWVTALFGAGLFAGIFKLLRLHRDINLGIGGRTHSRILRGVVLLIVMFPFVATGAVGVQSLFGTGFSRSSEKQQPSWIAQDVKELKGKHVLEVTMEMAMSGHMLKLLEEEGVSDDALRGIAMASSTGGIGPLLKERVIAQSNLGADITGVSLLYDKVWMQRKRDDGTLSMEKIQIGEHVRRICTLEKELDLEMNDGKIRRVKVWKAPRGAYGKAGVYFLDCPEITDVVYPGDRDARADINKDNLRHFQSWIVGRGALAVMKDVEGKRPDITVISEAPSMYVHHRMFHDKYSDDPFFNDNKYIFNDHTPLEYAHPHLNYQTLEWLRVDKRYYDTMPFWADNKVDATAMIINAAAAVFGVAEKHALVMRNMPLLKQFGEKIQYVTNGVSQFYWPSDELDINSAQFKSDDELASIKDRRRAALLRWIAKRQNLGDEWAEELIRNGNPVVIWTRRIVEYKRLERFADILENEEMRNRFIDSGIVFIFGGRIHQDDGYGLNQYNRVQRIIQQDPRLKNRVVFFDNYNIWEAPWLFRGTDSSVMLADDGREASATGFQKAQMNGALIIASNDGAVPESVTFYDGHNTHVANGFNVPYQADQTPTVEGFHSAMMSFADVFHDKQILRSMTRNALKETSRVSVDRAAKDMLMLLGNVQKRANNEKRILLDAQVGAVKALTSAGVNRAEVRDAVNTHALPFAWKYRPAGADEKMMLKSGHGLKAFLESAEYVRSMGSVGEWIMLTHSEVNTLHPAGDIIAYAQSIVKDIPQMQAVSAEIDSLSKEAAGTPSVEQRKSLNVAAIGILAGIYEYLNGAVDTEAQLSDRRKTGGSWFDNETYKSKAASLVETAVVVVVSLLSSLGILPHFANAEVQVIVTTALAAFVFWFPHLIFRDRGVDLKHKLAFSKDVGLLTMAYAGVGALIGLSIYAFVGSALFVAVPLTLIALIFTRMILTTHQLSNSYEERKTSKEKGEDTELITNKGQASMHARLESDIAEGRELLNSNENEITTKNRRFMVALESIGDGEQKRFFLRLEYERTGRTGVLSTSGYLGLTELVLDTVPVKFSAARKVYQYYSDPTHLNELLDAIQIGHMKIAAKNQTRESDAVLCQREILKQLKRVMRDMNPKAVQGEGVDKKPQPISVNVTKISEKAAVSADPQHVLLGSAIRHWVGQFAELVSPIISIAPEFFGKPYLISARMWDKNVRNRLHDVAHLGMDAFALSEIPAAMTDEMLNNQGFSPAKDWPNFEVVLPGGRIVRTEMWQHSYPVNAVVDGSATAFLYRTSESALSEQEKELVHSQVSSDLACYLNDQAQKNSDAKAAGIDRCLVETSNPLFPVMAQNPRLFSIFVPSNKMAATVAFDIPENIVLTPQFSAIVSGNKKILWEQLKNSFGYAFDDSHDATYTLQWAGQAFARQSKDNLLISPSPLSERIDLFSEAFNGDLHKASTQIRANSKAGVGVFVLSGLLRVLASNPSAAQSVAQIVKYCVDNDIKLFWEESVSSEAEFDAFRSAVLPFLKMGLHGLRVDASSFSVDEKQVSLTTLLEKLRKDADCSPDGAQIAAVLPASLSGPYVRQWSIDNRIIRVVQYAPGDRSKIPASELGENYWLEMRLDPDQDVEFADMKALEDEFTGLISDKVATYAGYDAQISARIKNDGNWQDFVRALLTAVRDRRLTLSATPERCMQRERRSVLRNEETVARLTREVRAQFGSIALVFNQTNTKSDPDYDRFMKEVKKNIIDNAELARIPEIAGFVDALDAQYTAWLNSSKNPVARLRIASTVYGKLSGLLEVNALREQGDNRLHLASVVHQDRYQYLLVCAEQLTSTVLTDRANTHGMMMKMLRDRQPAAMRPQEIAEARTLISKLNNIRQVQSIEPYRNEINGSINNLWALVEMRGPVAMPEAVEELLMLLELFDDKAILEIDYRETQEKTRRATRGMPLFMRVINGMA